MRALAQQFDVKLVHLPRARIPARLIERNRSFRFTKLTRAQWDDVRERLGELRCAWICVEGPLAKTA